MRLLSTLLCSLLLAQCFAQQIIVDSNTKKQYFIAFNKLPEDVKNGIARVGNELKDVIPTFAITEKYSTDTINKKETLPGAIRKKTEVEKILACGGGFTNDTFIISIGGGGQDEAEFFTFSIKNNIVSVKYKESHGWDSVFRNELSDVKSGDLETSCDVHKLILSSNKFIKGEIVYGYLDITTNAYFEDDDGFKNGYVKKKLSFSCWFRFVVDQKIY